jgi:uncharacterized protein YdhG (YjbR/CyaY superfamily)
MSIAARTAGAGMTAPASVEEYLAAVPAESRAALEQLRARIRAAAPHATETISYQMPAFRDGDRLFVSYAAFRDHCSLFPMSMAVAESFRDELGTSWNGKGTIHFGPHAPLAAGLVESIVGARLAENAARRRR